MLARCYNPNNKMYYRYGGRGIRVCDRWLGRDGFATFCSDMGQCPSGDYSIDRINNDGHYSPENCRWADRITQNRNTVRNRALTIDGETACLQAWSAKSLVSSHCIAKRIRRGWSAKDAVFTPEQSGRGGVKRRRRDHGEQLGVCPTYSPSPGGVFEIPLRQGSIPKLQGPYIQTATSERLLFIDGECKPIGLWMRITDVPRTVVNDRLKRGWSDRDALFTPSLGIGKKRPGIRKKAPQP